MKPKDYLKFFEELDELEQIEHYIKSGKLQKAYHLRNPKKISERDRNFIVEQDDSRKSFEFTYKASRHEAGWLLDSLGMFYEGKWISNVLRQIKGGKEANVYLCRSGVGVDRPYLAAKVYRPRMFRNLKNDSQYRVGRQDLDSSGNAIFDDGALHAIEKRTNFGEKLRHQSWIAYEYRTLQALDEAGANVPKPYAMGNNAILMEYIGDPEVAAPTLHTLDLEPVEAERIFARVLWNIDLMLSNEMVHGDLSAYNILSWKGDINLIDFPQVVSSISNPDAWSIFVRDVTRICEYFALQGVESDPGQVAMDLWRSHGNKFRKDVHPLYLDADNEDDRILWNEQNTK